MVRRLLILFLIVASSMVAGATTIEDRFNEHIQRVVGGGVTAVDFHDLYLPFAWRHTLPDVSLAQQALDRLAVVRQPDPLMTAELQLLRARLALDAGEPATAREVFAELGGVSRWWVHGPFPIEELGDVVDRDLPADDADWRAATGTDPMGWVRVSGMAWPARRQLVYLAATVDSELEQAVAVRLGASQVARVWLNGDEILLTPHPLRRAEDQHVAGGWLRQGRNLLVAAVASENEDWWLRVRLTAPDGSPLERIRGVDELPQPRLAVDRPVPKIRSIEEELRQEMAGGSDRAAISLASYLVARSPLPVESGDTRPVCQAARAAYPGEARLLEWYVTSEPAAARELLEDAVAEDDSLVWARIELARWYHGRALHELAHEVLAPAIDDPAVAATGLEMDASLWGSVVVPKLIEVSRSEPRCVEAAVILANQAIEDQRWQLAREAVDRLREVVPGSDLVLELQQRLARGCGDTEGLRELLDEEVRRDPNHPELRILLARLVSATEGRVAARAPLLEGLGRCPDNVDLLMELSQLEHSEGNEPEAVELARRVLVLRPQDRRAQRLLALLGEGGEDLGWLRTPEELWQLADAAPRGTPAVVALDRIEIRFLPSQLTEKRAQQAFLITSAEQADRFLTHTLPYVSERQRLRVLAARILRRDGTEIAGRQSDTARLSEPEYNLFYDTRLRVLQFDELSDGDLIEISYVLSETAEANETGRYEGGVVPLGHSVPTALTEVELSGPEDEMPAWELVNLRGEPEEVHEERGMVRLKWRWSELAAAPIDVPPAPRELTMPYLVYSNLPEWGDLASWYERHIAPRVRPSRQVEELALRLTEGVTDRAEKIARIYRYVTMDIDYVGLEFGEHRFRPFSADWVVNHGIGDCKDKAALMVALYGAIDIPVRMVMVRTAERGIPSSELAVLEVFDHAIAYLPEDDMWLDGTASGHAPFPPPTMCQGAQVLVVDGPESRPQITPSPGGGMARLQYSLSRRDDGRMELEVRTEDTGEAADRRRARFAGSRDPQRIARWLQRQFPGADLVGEPKLRLLPGRDPAIMEIEATVARSALLGTGGIQTLPGDLNLAVELIPSGERSTPLLLPVRPDLEWRVEVELGRPPEPLPDDVTLHGDFGSLTLEYHELASGYRVEGAFGLQPGLVTAADAPALREFLVTVERHLSRRLEVP